MYIYRPGRRRRSLRLRVRRWLRPAGWIVVLSGLFGLTGDSAGTSRLTVAGAVSGVETIQDVVDARDSAAGRLQSEERSGFIRGGDSILILLQREGFTRAEAYSLFSDVRSVYDLSNLHVGHGYSLYLSDNRCHRFDYHIEPGRRLQADRRTQGGWTGKLVEIPTVIQRENVSGNIATSLYSAVIESGEGAELADRLASLYEFDIDFNRDIRPGDRFTLLTEKYYMRGELIGYGPILAARIRVRGKVIAALRYTTRDGRTDYYHPDGSAVQKMFLRCPLPFMRVTSRYGWRRHPLLNFSRRHQGVDLGAPAGTVVRATASGTVQRAVYHRVRGRNIAIRHANGFVTQYLHLRSFARGIRRGQRVEQGQVIGYVGSTGRSTGPHLHYGVLKNGRYINPLRMKLPSRKAVAEAEMEDFRFRRNALFFRLDNGAVIRTITGILRRLGQTISAFPRFPHLRAGPANRSY